MESEISLHNIILYANTYFYARSMARARNKGRKNAHKRKLACVRAIYREREREGGRGGKPWTIVPLHRCLGGDYTVRGGVAVSWLLTVSEISFPGFSSLSSPKFSGRAGITRGRGNRKKNQRDFA